MPSPLPPSSYRIISSRAHTKYRIVLSCIVLCVRCKVPTAVQAGMELADAPLLRLSRPPGPAPRHVHDSIPRHAALPWACRRARTQTQKRPCCWPPWTGAVNALRGSSLRSRRRCLDAGNYLTTSCAQGQVPTAVIETKSVLGRQWGPPRIKKTAESGRRRGPALDLNLVSFRDAPHSRVAGVFASCLLSFPNRCRADKSKGGSGGGWEQLDSSIRDNSPSHVHFVGENARVAVTVWVVPQSKVQDARLGPSLSTVSRMDTWAGGG